MVDHPSAAIVSPVFNDWDALANLIGHVDNVLEDQDAAFSFFAVNDGSTVYPTDFAEKLPSLRHIKHFEIIHLHTNLGHQRAIAVGLTEVSARHQFDFVIVMDADGEDQPEDLVRLLNAHTADPDNIVVARRSSRSETTPFRFAYTLYKLVFHMLIGRSIDFGNFCLIPIQSLKKLVYEPGIWNHLAGSLMKNHGALTRVNTERGSRYSGRSSMNYQTLLVHGLSAISVHIETVLTRLLILASVILAVVLCLVGLVVWIRLFTNLAIPGWATSTVGILLIIMFQLLALIASTIFGVLNRRSGRSMIPAIDASIFIEQCEVISKHE